jgi:hypothetical protein
VTAMMIADVIGIGIGIVIVIATADAIGTKRGSA